MSKSAIEWTEDTWNPVIGCTRVSEGCRNCYAERMSARLASMADADAEKGRPPSTRKHNYTRVVKYKDGYALPQWNNRIVCVDEALGEPLKRRKSTTYFVNSMSDLFHKDVPFEFIDKVFAVMALTPQHTYQVLTKRPERMAEYSRHDATQNRAGLIGDVADSMRREFGIGDPTIGPLGHGEPGEKWYPLSNVWLGTSVEDQAAADTRIPHLLRCQAAVRFLSLEPLLGPVDLTKTCINPPQETASADGSYWYAGDAGVDWLIVGGESGPGARPCNAEWIRSIIQQGKAAGVPVFVKQLGKVPTWAGMAPPQVFHDKKGADMAEWPEDLRVREYPGCLTVDQAE